MPDILKADVLDALIGQPVPPALSTTSDMPVVEKVEPEDLIGSETDEAAEQVDESEGKKSKGGFQRRIDELTRARKEAEAVAERERARADEAFRLAQSLAPKTTEQPAKQEQEDPEPMRDAYDDPEKYIEDKSAWIARKEVRQSEARRAQEAAERQNKARVDSLRDQMLVKVEKAKEKYPDFETVALKSDVPLSQPMAYYIATEADGTDVQYHLAKNPDLCKQIAALEPVQQVVRLAKLSIELSAPKPNTSSAPEPIVPLRGGRGAGTVSDAEPGMNEYAERRNAQLRGKR
jgi:hypothetical protein